MNILVCGDSFSYGTKGWVQHIKGNVTNKSENGVGQYKIFKQTVGHEKFDKILICHTSPWRIHTSNHPLHKDNKERPNNDFMLADLDHNQHVLPQIEDTDDIVGSEPIYVSKTSYQMNESSKTSGPENATALTRPQAIRKG